MKFPALCTYSSNGYRTSKMYPFVCMWAKFRLSNIIIKWGGKCSGWTLTLYFSPSISGQQLTWAKMLSKSSQNFWAPKIHIWAGACKVLTYSETYFSCRSCLTLETTLWHPKIWQYLSTKIQGPNLHIWGFNGTATP